MKNATKIMHTIGKIFTIIEIVGAVILAVLGIVCVANSTDVYAQLIADGYSHFQSPEQVKAAGIMMIVVGAIIAAVEIVVLCLATRAQKAIAKNEKTTTPHIVMIVVGVFSNVFYLLGGVFGVLSVEEK